MFNEFKKNFKLGLVGLLSLGLAGCATIYDIPTITREAPAPVWRESKRKKVSSKITYSIGNLKQDGYILNVPVTESKEDAIKITMVADAQTRYEKITEKIYKDKPAANIPVNFSGMIFSVDDKLTLQKLTTTNSEGIARIQIAALPIFEYLDELNKKGHMQRLKKGMKQSLASRTNIEEMVDTEIGPEHKLDVKTIAKEDALLTNDDNFEFIDAKRTFYVRGKKLNPSKLFSYIQREIETDLKNKYMLRAFTIRAVGEDLMPLDAQVEFKAVKTLSLEEVLREVEKIKNNYLVKGEELYEQIKIDPSSVVANRDGQKLYVPAEGLPFLVNVPSQYDIRVVKEEYAPIEERIIFKEKSLPVLEMGMEKVGERVNIGKSKSKLRYRSQ